MIRTLRLLVPRRQLAFPGEPWPHMGSPALAPGLPAVPQGDHRHDANQVDYANGGYPALTDVKLALDHLLFVPMSVALTGGSVLERGQSIASVALAWTISKGISAQVLSGPGVPSIGTLDRAATAAGPFTADSTWSIQATSADASEIKTGSTSLVFRSRRHWGTAAAAALDDADLLALLSDELATSRQQTRTLTCADEYMWFAWPTEFGVPDFWANGLQTTGWVEVIRNHTNSYGHTRSYRIYRSAWPQTGSVSIEVR